MDNISFLEAQKIASTKLAEKAPDGRFAIADDATKEYLFGWVFICASKKYIQTKNINDAIPAFGPLVVDRDGHAEFFSSAIASDAAASEYLSRWKMHRH